MRVSVRVARDLAFVEHHLQYHTAAQCGAHPLRCFLRNVTHHPRCNHSSASSQTSCCMTRNIGVLSAIQHEPCASSPDVSIRISTTYSILYANTSFRCTDPGQEPMSLAWHRISVLSRSLYIKQYRIVQIIHLHPPPGLEIIELHAGRSHKAFFQIVETERQTFATIPKNPP